MVDHQSPLRWWDALLDANLEHRVSLLELQVKALALSVLAGTRKPRLPDVRQLRLEIHL